MFLNRMSVALFIAIGVTSVLPGCNTKPTEQAQPSAQQPPHSDHDHSGHDHSASDMEKMKAELAKLSPEDAAAAESQHVCPVTGEMLGTMGPPIKVDVKGTQVWICCDGCRDKLQSDADTYLANLKKK